MRVLGVDPGLAATGIALVEGCVLKVSNYAFGSITTPAGLATPERLGRIYDGIQKAISSQEPEFMAIEEVFSLGRHPKSGIILGNVTGVILLAAFHAGLPVMEIAVREAKRVLTGSGSAGKAQLEACVRTRLNHPEPIRPAHASDALALALVGFYRKSVPGS